LLEMPRGEDIGIKSGSRRRAAVKLGIVRSLGNSRRGKTLCCICSSDS
jgi:hypothetical protein